MYFLNPSFLYQFVFVDKTGEFYLNEIEIVFFFLNLIICALLPFSFVSHNGAFRYISFLSFIVLIWQVVNPSMFCFYSKVPNTFFNEIGIMGYSLYLVLFIGLSSYQITDIFINKIKINDFSSFLKTIVLLLPILFPYILLSRYSAFVTKNSAGKIDLLGIYEGLTVERFSFSHVIYVTGNILVFYFYCFFIKSYFRGSSINDLLLVLLTGLIGTVIYRRSTYLFKENVGFYLLPDSPCAVGSFVAFIGLLFKKEKLINYSILITFIFTFFNNVILFQGNINNFWNFLTMDSTFYHLYAAIISFNMIHLKNDKFKKKDAFESGIIFAVIYLIFTFIGNLQTRVEFVTHVDLVSNKYVGFFYDTPLFSFLYEFSHFLGYEKNGFCILPINWLLSIFASFGISSVSYHFYNGFIFKKTSIC